MARNTADEILTSLLPEWHKLLQGWSADGSLVAAAQEALMIQGEPPTLRDLVTRWAAGDFTGLPTIFLLSSADINGALGAYAISTGAIYLNADWLATATPQRVNAVLTEELGHHLDGLLKSSDTLGDEGELFAALLKRKEIISTEERLSLLGENDTGYAVVGGSAVSVEQATVTSTQIPAIYPGRTNNETRNRYAFAALKQDGSVVAWGNQLYGGDSTLEASRLTSGVSQIFSNNEAFAALKSDGSVVTWGDKTSGGDSSSEAANLSSGVIKIFSTERAFAALKSNGSVIAWGDSNYGGDSSSQDANLQVGVSQISATTYAFAALKADGSVVTWGGTRIRWR